MAGTKTNALDRKKRIITAAIKLWRQAHNVNKVSLSDVAQKAGVAPTTVYNIFSNREGLVHEVIRQLVEDILGKQQAILKSDLPFTDKMQAMITAKMKPIHGIEQDVLDKLCNDPVARQYATDSSEAAFKPLMTAIIRQGKREGYIRADTPDEAIILYIEVLRSGGIACAEEMRRIISDKKMLLAFTRLIYFGLFKKEFPVSLNATEKES